MNNPTTAQSIDFVGEGLASVGIVSLTEALAEANCTLESAAQYEASLKQDDANYALQEARFRVQLARQHRDAIFTQLQLRIQKAQAFALPS